jgi:hypothetical protein
MAAVGRHASQNERRQRASERIVLSLQSTLIPAAEKKALIFEEKSMVLNLFRPPRLSAAQVKPV